MNSSKVNIIMSDDLISDKNNQIYRNIPAGYNKNDNFLERRTKIYNPSPVIANRLSTTYQGIKNEIKAYQAIDIISSIIKKVNYFTFDNKLYKITDLPFQTLYKNENKKLISDEKLFSSTQKSFLDEHLGNKNIPIPTYNSDSPDVLNSVTPLNANFFKSNELSGLNKLEYKKLQVEHQNILKIMFYYFILKFNVEAKKKNFDLPYYQWTNYEITDSQLVKIQYHKTLNLYYYTFIVEIFRRNKHYGFSIYLGMFFKPEKFQIWIDKAYLIGVVPQAEIVFKDLDAYNFNANKSFNFSGANKDDESILDNVFTQMQDYTKRREMSKSISYNLEQRNHELNDGHRCFKPNGESFPDAQNSNSCLSMDPMVPKTGVWDKECQKDEDCPFFQANKNYPNTFGGCKNGFCELPVGMNRIGFKHYDKQKPMCYNCNLKTEVMTADGYSVIKERTCTGVECNKCCDIQLNKKIYPNLKSPDFVFPNDQLERAKYKELLSKNQLGIDDLLHN